MKALKDYLLEAHPALLIGIARSGLRLLEVLFHYDDKLKKKLISKLISEKAMPFMPVHQVKDVVVVDDLVLFGSTFSEILSDVSSMFQTEPKAVGFAACDETVDPKFKKILRRFLPLSENQIDWYCDTATQAFRTLGKTYDVDHPVLKIQISKSVRTYDDIVKLLNNTGFRFTETTTIVEEENGIFSFCMNYISSPNLLSILLNPEFVSITGPQKVRFQFVLPRNVLVINPICPVRISPDQSINIMNGIINDKWFSNSYNILNEPLIYAIQSLKRGFYKKGTKLGIGFVQILTFLVEYVLGVSVAKMIFDSENNDDIINSVDLADEDLRFLFGQEMASMLHRFHSDYNEELMSQPIELSQSVFADDDPEQKLIHTDLWEKIEPRLSEDSLRITSASLVPIHVLLAMRDIMDYERRSSQEIGSEGRLRNGFHYYEWKLIISNLCKRVNKNWDTAFLSPIFDHLIDCGALVPVYAQSQDYSLGRVFRFGEGIDRPRKLNYFLTKVTHYLLTRSESQRLTTKRLPRMLWEKTIVAMLPLISENIPWNTRVNLYVLKEFEKFGARLIVSDYGTLYDLRTWGIENGILARANEDTGNELTDNYYFNPESLREYAKVEDDDFDAKVLSPAKSIVELMLFLASKIEPRKRGKQVGLQHLLLALTTCGNEEDTHCAIKGELEIWLGLKLKERYATKNYRSFLTNLRALAEQELTGEPIKVQQISKVKRFLEEHLAVLPAQAKVKSDLFYNRIDSVKGWVYKQLDEAPVYQTIWDTYFHEVFDPTASESKQIDKLRLEGFTKLMKTISSLSRTLMNELGYWEDSRKENERRDKKKELKDCAYYVRRYNIECAEIIERDYTLNLRSIPEGFINDLRGLSNTSEKLKVFVTEISKVFENLRSVYITCFPGQTITELRTEYPIVTMVMYDIKKSSNSHRDEDNTAKLAKINQIIADYAKTLDDEWLDASIEPVTNDRNHFLLESPINAIKLASHIAEASDAVDIGVKLRIGICESKSKVPIVTLLNQNNLMNSDLFVITDRIMNCKDHVLEDFPKVTERDGDTDIFLDEATQESLLSSSGIKLSESQFTYVTSIKPKGKALPDYLQISRFNLLRPYEQQLSLKI